MVDCRLESCWNTKAKSLIPVDGCFGGLLEVDWIRFAATLAVLYYRINREYLPGNVGFRAGLFNAKIS